MPRLTALALCSMFIKLIEWAGENHHALKRGRSSWVRLEFIVFFFPLPGSPIWWSAWCPPSNPTTTRRVESRAPHHNAGTRDIGIPDEPTIITTMEPGPVDPSQHQHHSARRWSRASPGAPLDGGGITLPDQQCQERTMSVRLAPCPPSRALALEQATLVQPLVTTRGDITHRPYQITARPAAPEAQLSPRFGRTGREQRMEQPLGVFYLIVTESK
jgi:hypothetical protein